MADEFTPAPVDDVTKFDSGLNVNWHAADYDGRLGAARAIVGGSIATVTDFGASVWNSLPLTPEVETQDILQRVSNDALQVYNENPDMVHTASFVGGSLVPFGLATKGMNLARSGVKGANWFSEAGKAEDMANLTKIFSEAGREGTAYKAQLRSIYGKGFANQALDAVAGEIAVMGLMHAHPLMEDYMQDPVKNFAIGLGLGAVVGGSIGLIADRAAVRGALGKIEYNSLAGALKDYRGISEDMTGAVALQSHGINIQNFDGLLAEGKVAGKDSTNDLTMSFVEKLRTNEISKQQDLFKFMARNDETLAAMPEAEVQPFLKAISERPEMYGVDEVGFFKASQGTKSPMTLTAQELTITKPGSLPEFNSGHQQILMDEVFNATYGDLQKPLGKALAFAVGQDSANPTAVIGFLATAKAAGRDDIVAGILKNATTEKQLASSGYTHNGTVEAWDSLIKKYTPDEVTVIKVKGASPALEAKPKLTQEKTDIDGNVTKQDINAVYYPEFQAYGKAKDVVNYGNATVLNKTLKQLEQDLPSSYGKMPNLDSSLEMIHKSAPVVHGEFIAARARVEKWTAEELATRVLGENDLPLISAIVMRMRGDFDLAKNVRIQLANRNPVFKAIEEEFAATKGLNKAGVPQSYADAVYEFTAPNKIAQYRPGALNPLDKEAAKLISNWVGGDQAALNRAALAWSGKGFSKVSDHIIDIEKAKALGHGPNEIAGFEKHNANVAANGNKAQFEAIYNSTESQALRAKFAALADADGNVLLYRGSHASKITQQNILESFSTDPAKAAEFGTVRLQKVHVDNIVAGWGDLASKDGLSKNEVIVLPTARPDEAVLSSTGEAKFKAGQSKSFEGGTVVKNDNKQVTFGDLRDLLITEKQRQMDEMFAQGIPAQTISLKTDTPLNTVLSYGAGKNGGAVSLEEMIGDNLEALVKTKSIADAEAALNISQTPMKLSGNQIKNPYVEGHMALDNKSMADMANTMTETIMASVKNETVNQLGTLIHGEMKLALDAAKQQVFMANNMLAGAKFLQSSDFFARNMGSLGPVFGSIGRSVEHLNNEMIGRVVAPVKEALALIAKDSTGAATLEFNTFFNINASLKGWRSFQKDGTLVQKEMATDAAGKQVEILKPVTLNGQAYKVANPDVQRAIMSMQERGGELLTLRNAGRKIKGQADTSDIGLYIPSMNPVGKYIAYVHDATTDSTKMIYANTKEHYADSVREYKKYLKESGQDANIKVYEKDIDQERWSQMNGRLDTVDMERADVGLQKTGSGSSALVRTDANVLSEIVGGYEHYITKNIRDLAELNMYELTGMLDNMSILNQAGFKNQPLTKVQKVVQAPQDAALTMKNTLLGNSNLGEYGGWKSINQSFETGLAMGIGATKKIWDTAVSVLPGSAKSGLNAEKMKAMNYEKMVLEMEKQGIVNPFAVFDGEAAKMYGLASISDSKDISKRIVYASNALVATMALRVGELAQPLVNMLSLPILTGLAINTKMPAEFLGKKLGTADLGALGGSKIMYEGMRAMNSPQYRALSAKWEAAGHYSPLVSEASAVARLSRSFEKGAITKIENALDSNVVKIMSKPADWSESFVRKMTMHTGAVLAKRLYPELDDAGITIFARDFMDKAVGNFSAAQRPVFFQGTLGTALGLFQTYMLTLGQSVYRQLEMRNYKALGKAALTQSTIFGGGSLPGFHQVSEMIGEHFSDDNVDLVTGTYRALGDTAADFALYGLPSNLGPAVYSRGDVSIRPPNILGGMQNTVAVSAASQMFDMLSTFKDAMSQDNASMGRAFGQALSMQSMSRPLARGAELATGYSVTKKGNTVQVPEEVWTTTGIISRVLGTRPLEEGKLREAMHLNTFYGSVDRDAREKLLAQLKTGIRSGDLSDEFLTKISGDYLRKGGTPSGWRSAYSKAIAHTEEDGKGPLLEKLSPRNPLNFMIHNLD